MTGDLLPVVALGLALVSLGVSLTTFAVSAKLTLLVIKHATDGHPSGRVPASRLRPPPGYGSFKPPNSVDIPVFDDPPLRGGSTDA